MKVLWILTDQSRGGTEHNEAKVQRKAWGSEAWLQHETACTRAISTL